MTVNKLKFLSFFREGFGVPVTVELQIKGTNNNIISPDLNIEESTLTPRGPESIIGIQSNIIARVYPPSNSNTAEPNYFVYVDFKDPDFLWRFTPVESLDTSIENQRTDPWITLLILKKQDIDEMMNNKDENGDPAPISVFSKINDKDMLTVKRKFLPRDSIVWANGHLQLTNYDKEDILKDTIESFMSSNHDKNNSRLLAFYRLEPQKVYYAFIVPVFKKSLLPFNLVAEDPSTVTNQKIWTKTGDTGENVNVTFTFPIYYSWTFTTGKKGDFEKLARDLEPVQTPGNVGAKDVDSTMANSIKNENTGEFELDPVNPYHYHRFKREGALASPGFTNEDYVPTATEPEIVRRDTYNTLFVENQHKQYALLKQTLNESIKFEPSNQFYPYGINDESDDVDPLVSFPIYGRYFRYVPAIKDHLDLSAGVVDLNDSAIAQYWKSIDPRVPWIHEINLDLRNRVAASFGTTVIQNNQDDYSKECWDQVGPIIAVNQKMRLTKSGFHLSKRIYENLLSKISVPHLLFMSLPFHNNIGTTTKSCNKTNTIKSALRNCGLPIGFFSPKFMLFTYQKFGSSALFNPENKIIPRDATQKIVNPKISLSSPLTDLTGLAELHYNTNLKNVVFMESKIDQGMWTSSGNNITLGIVNINTLLVQNGSHDLYVQIYDSHGNMALTKEAIVINNDIEPPNITIHSPSGSLGGIVTLTIGLTDRSQISVVEASLDGGTNWNSLPLLQNNLYQLNIDTRSIPNGNFTFKIRAKDVYGNVSTIDQTVTIKNDFQKPSINILVPSGTLNGTVLLSAEVTDNDKVGTVTFSLDSASWSIMRKSALKPNTYSIQLDTTQFENGRHTLRIKALDLSQNFTEASTIITIENDLTPPEIAVLKPDLQISNILQGTVTIAIRVMDESGVANALYSIDNRLTYHQMSGHPFNNELFQTEINTLNYPDGAYKLYIKAIDLKRNSKEDVFTFIILNEGTIPPGDLNPPGYDPGPIVGQTGSLSDPLASFGANLILKGGN